MSWRQNMGIKMKNNLSEPIRNNSNIHTNKNIADIALKDEQLKTPKVEKMKTCLDGQACGCISLQNDRPVCKKSGQPIFDMPKCPVGRWYNNKIIFAQHDRAVFKWCTSCKHRCYKQSLFDNPVLWCLRTDGKVADLRECPDNHWHKNFEGCLLAGENPIDLTSPDENSISPAFTAKKIVSADKPETCMNCPASALWNSCGYTGYFCFHDAYFLGKSNTPIRIELARPDCPLLP